MSTYKSLKSFLIKLFFNVLNGLIQYRPFLSLFNFLYERAPDRVINLTVHYIKRPAKRFDWTILLVNGKKVKTKVYPEDIKTWQFAISYKWQDPGLNWVETILDEYYPKNIPWIDIGANLGMRSLTPLSSKRPVYFIEPNTELNVLNEERCRDNNFSNYHFLPFGISDSDGEMHFFIDKSSYLSSFHKDVLNDSDILKDEVVPIKKLDTIFSNQMEEIPGACVKIDTEGHEKNVIEGARDFIVRLSPTLIVEINEKGQHAASILGPLTKSGYTVYEIWYKNPRQFLSRVENDANFVTQSFKTNNFLLVKDNGLDQILRTYAY